MLKYKFDFFPSRIPGALANCNISIQTSDKHLIKLNGALVRESKQGSQPWLALPNFPVTKKDGDKVYIPYLNFEDEDRKDLVAQAIEAFGEWNQGKNESPRPKAPPKAPPKHKTTSLDYEDDDIPF